MGRPAGGGCLDVGDGRRARSHRRPEAKEEIGLPLDPVSRPSTEWVTEQFGHGVFGWQITSLVVVLSEQIQGLTLLGWPCWVQIISMSSFVRARTEDHRILN